MCFSATASFVAGGVLSAAGVVTVAKVKKKQELPLASVPLLFGVQQLIDGAVWVSFGVLPVHTIAVYAYALLAFVWWPMFVPLALLRIEPRRARREVLKAISLVGLAVGLYFAYFMVNSTVTAQIVNRCVAYDVPHPYGFVALAFYLVVTVGPFFASSKKALNVFGVVLLGSFAVAGWFYVAIFSSVWCFFAAILSGLLYWYFENGTL